MNKKRRNSEQIIDMAYVMTPQPTHDNKGFGDASKNINGFGGGFGDFTANQTHKFTKLPPLKKVSEPKSPLRRGGSMSYGHEKHTSKRKMRITSNISLLVKKYATFLFEEEGLRTDKDNLTQDQFTKLIDGHEKIFASYF